jgi:hypothetical protein
VWHIARMGEKSAYMILVETPEGKTVLGRPRRTEQDNVKMYIVIC